MNQIIKETLNDLPTNKEKLFYLMYAFKEWIIGSVVVLLFILMLFISNQSTPQAALTVRFLTSSPQYEVSLNTQLNEVENIIKKQLLTENPIDLNITHLDNSTEVQTLLLQLAAEEIDLLIVNQSESDNMNDLLDDKVILTSTYKFNDDSLSHFNAYQTVNTRNEDKIYLLFGE